MRAEYLDVKPCVFCGGTGDEDGCPQVPCAACDGTGMIPKTPDELRGEGLLMLVNFIKDVGPDVAIAAIIKHYDEKK